MSMPRIVSLTALICAGICVESAQSAGRRVWPSFQNGGRVSISLSAEDDALRLSPEIAWTAELPGYGQSSPVVWGDHVYVTSVTGANKETYHVVAYEIETGAKVWSQTLANATPQESSNYVSKAAPTPAADENGLVAFFEGGNLIALTHDGEIRWQRNLVEDFGPIEARHGLSASVEQDADSAYIWVERTETPYVLSVNKQTGETNWKVEGVGATSWASPRLVPVGDGHHLVLSAIGHIVGLDPQSGDRLWSFEGISGNSTPTPVPVGDGRFLIGATVGRGEASGGRAAESNGLIGITHTSEGLWNVDYVWRAERATSSFGSPIAHDRLAYFVNRSGVLYGLDLDSGEERFAERLEGSAWATPIGVGDRLFVFSKEGSVSLLTQPASARKLTTWAALPADPAATGQAGPFAGSVLYAASWCGDIVLLRRGDWLFAVRTEKERQE